MRLGRADLMCTARTPDEVRAAEQRKADAECELRIEAGQRAPIVFVRTWEATSDDFVNNSTLLRLAGFRSYKLPPPAARAETLQAMQAAGTFTPTAPQGAE
jgi:hypothetical protein